MLIFISDLHFVDGTAGEHNVPTDAFRIFFEEIAGACNWLKSDGNVIQEIKLVFLGDIFDVLRTERWFSVDKKDRPWGNNEKNIEANANIIFDNLIKKNKTTFDLLKTDLKNEFALPVEPERIYVPGNHDRLCNKYSSLRKKVRENLGISGGDDLFEHKYENVLYGVCAKHGHEYDKYNYEGGLNQNYDDYMRTPIGDPITTEIASKIPWMLMKHPAVKKLSEHDRGALKRNMQDIDNVRPFSAIVEWLLYQVKKNINLKEAIEDTVDKVIKEFKGLDFTKKWYRHHDKWTDFWDEADKLQALLFLLEKFKIFPSEKLMPYIEKLKKMALKDPMADAAANEYLSLDSRIQYVVYGHTHDPLQVPLRRIEAPSSPREQIYLNTGTWRTRYNKNRFDLGFIGWKNLTYTVFYSPKERDSVYPAFETWTGTLKKV